MSNFTGASSGQPVATQATRYNGMQVQGSQYGMGLPIVYGQQRLAGTLIWYGDFQSVEHKQSVGKGGGGVSTSYTYSSSFQLAICEGPIAGIPTIWKDSGTTSFSDVNGTYSLGTQNQAAWSHLSGADALQYPYTAWVGCLNLALGSSPNVPNFNFEIAGLFQFAPTASPAIIDADPSVIFSDLLSSTTHGLSFGAFLGDLTLYHNYCLANNIFLSLVVDQQTTMNEILTRLLQVTNSNTAWSNGKLIVIPYGDESATANGVTYTPPTTVQKYFTDSDYIKPVRVDQKPLSDLYNVVRVEYVNRANNYNTSVAEAKDQADIDNTFGVRQQEMIQGHSITNGTLAQWVAQTILQRALYIRNTYTFTTTMENVAFEPGDVIALTDSQCGLLSEPVRIKSISEQGTNELQFVCEEFPAGVASGATQSVEAPAGYVPSVNGAPDATQPPVIFRAPQFLTNGAPEVWIGVGGAGPNWGGANVLLSLDNVSYAKIGTVAPGCRYGTLTAALATSATDPDTVNSFTVALDAGGTLSGGTQAEADNLATLMLVDQELLSYETTVLNGNGTYTLGNGYLRRGCYETTIAAHSIGAPWLRVDDSVFRWQVDPSWVGLTVYLKFQPWNLYGGGLVSEASLTAVTYVVGTAEEIPDTPPVPTNFTATGAYDGIHLTWTTPNPAAVAITSVERSPDNATWTVVGQVNGTAYVDPVTDFSTHYYRARARSPQFTWSAYATSVTGARTTKQVIPAVTAPEQATAATTTVWANLDHTSTGAIQMPGAFAWDAYVPAGGNVDVAVGLKVDGSGNYDGYMFRVGTNNYCLAFLSSGGAFTILTPSVTTLVTPGWHSGAVVVTSPQTFEYYIDGQLIATVSDTTYELTTGNEFGYSYSGTAGGSVAPPGMYTGFLDNGRRISTVNGGMSPLGSIPPFTSNGQFTYTSTSSSITWSWPAMTVYRNDGSTTAVGANSLQITGLAASTTYYFYPYLRESDDTIQFAEGYQNSAGTPAAAYTAASPNGAAYAAYYANAPIGTLSAPTPASGSGGGGGNLVCCLNGRQLIELAHGIATRASALEAGQFLRAPTGAVRVRQVKHAPWNEWIRVSFNNGAALLVVHDHRLIDPSGAEVRVRDLHINQIVESAHGPICVTGLEAISEPGTKVSIEVDPPHVYYVQGVLSHNKGMC